MLPKLSKLRSQKDILQIIKTRIRTFNPYFTLFIEFDKNQKKNYSKTVVTVSKKILKSSPDRKRVQRKLIAVILKHKLNKKNPDMNFLIKITNKNILRLKEKEIYNLFIKDLKKYFQPR